MGRTFTLRRALRSTRQQRASNAASMRDVRHIKHEARAPAPRELSEDQRLGCQVQAPPLAGKRPKLAEPVSWSARRGRRGQERPRQGGQLSRGAALGAGEVTVQGPRQCGRVGRGSPWHPMPCPSPHSVPTVLAAPRRAGIQQLAKQSSQPRGEVREWNWGQPGPSSFMARPAQGRRPAPLCSLLTLSA